MNMTIGPNGESAAIYLANPQDIKRAAKLWNLGINCQSDRGKDAEEVGDQLRDAANQKVVL